MTFIGNWDDSRSATAGLSMALIRRRHGLEHRQARKQGGPGRAIAVENRHGGAEDRWVVQGAGVEGVGIGLADDAAEHQAAAGGTEVAGGVAAPGRPAAELACRPG